MVYDDALQWPEVSESMARVQGSELVRDAAYQACAKVAQCPSPCKGEEEKERKKDREFERRVLECKKNNPKNKACPSYGPARAP